MTDLDRALKDALVLGLENDATAEHILRIAAPFIDRAFRDQNNRIEKLEAALRVYADEDHWFGDKFEPIMFPEGECKCCYEHFSDQGEIARKALEGKDD